MGEAGVETLEGVFGGKGGVDVLQRCWIGLTTLQEKNKLGGGKSTGHENGEFLTTHWT